MKCSWSLAVFCSLALAGIASAASTIYAATKLGPFKSTDGGNTWQQLMVTTNDPSLPGEPSTLVITVDPQTVSTIYAFARFTSPSGQPLAFLKSTDAGATWTVVSKPAFSYTFSTGALLAIDPVKTNFLYTMNADSGMEVTSDGGVTWSAPTIPKPTGSSSGGTSNQPSLAGVATDPNHSGVVYVIGGNAAFHPGKGYLLKSTDFGNTWSLLTSVAGFGSRLFLNPKNSLEMYGTSLSNIGCTVSGGQCGIYKSTDGGQSWTELNIPEPIVGTVAIDVTPGLLYAVGNESNVYTSTDGGTTWNPVFPAATPLTPNFVTVVRADPNAASTAYANGPANADMVSRTADGGASWPNDLVEESYKCGSQTCENPAFIYDLVVAPQAQTALPAPVITSVLNGASFQPGIVADSWVTIKGMNLAAQSDDWSNSIVNGALPGSVLIWALALGFLGMGVIFRGAIKDPSSFKFVSVELGKAHTGRDIPVTKLERPLLIWEIHVLQSSADHQNLCKAGDLLNILRVPQDGVQTHPDFNCILRGENGPMTETKLVERTERFLVDRLGRQLICDWQRPSPLEQVGFCLKSDEPSYRFPLVLENKVKPIMRINIAGLPRLNRNAMDIRDEHPGAFAVHQSFYIRLCCLGLSLDFGQSAQSGLHATPTNYKESKSKQSGRCGADRDYLVPYVLLGCSSLFIGGLCVSLWAMFNLNDKRRALRAALEYGGFGILAVGWLTWWGGLIFGLPPGWPPCYPYGDAENPRPHGITVSQKLLTPALFTYYNNYMANVLSMDKQVAIVGALCEGSSIRSIERMTGVHRDTIMRLGVRVGQGCATMLDSKMRNLGCEHLQLDEIWGFVGKKDKNVKPGDSSSLGSVWTFCAIDSDTKLVPSFAVGKRDRATADAFMGDLGGRLANRVQLSADALSEYVGAIEQEFGADVDFAQIIKSYIRDEAHPERQYSPSKITITEKRRVMGDPDMQKASTSYIERLNGTTRLHMRRLTRLTYAFSKKLENFEAAVALHFAYYNLVLRHSTLRCTPAMAAGIESGFWSVGQLVEAATA